MTIKIIKIKDIEEGAQILATKICAPLLENKKVVWFVPGGSNIPLSVRVMKIISEKITDKEMANLTVTLTDERYGEVGHKDSNWKILIDAGFDFSKVKNLPVLCGKSESETIKEWNKNIQNIFIKNDFFIGQFGIGNDGHIAGILPYTLGVESDEYVVGYHTDTYHRITLTLNTIKKINEALAFVFNKEEMLSLLEKETDIKKMPAIVLALSEKANIYKL